jgi:aminopeptidase N
MNKNIKKIVIISIAVVLLVIFAFLLFTINKDKGENRNVYNLTATVDGAYLDGEMTLDYFNGNEYQINELSFCLYPNAFKNEENINNVVVSGRVDEAYPNGFNEGYIKIKEINVDGKKADYLFEENEQILTVKTGKIKRNANIKIYIKFEEKLPDSPMRFGYGSNTYNFGNWYPVLCPFEDGKAVKSLYTACGDPFYSECADYNVKLHISPEFRVASSGKILSKKTDNPLFSEWSIKGENIRDFAFVISSCFNLKSQMVGNTLVYSYYLSDDEMGSLSLEYAKNAILTYNKLFGEYPYDTFSVVAADFYIGGMEYPNLVMIDKDLYTPLMNEALEEVIVHEAAHQWWYGIVGNNEINEPWLDEGLTQYSVALYYEKTYGKERYNAFLNESELYTKIVFDIVKDSNGSVNKKIDRKSTDFEHWLLYDALCYDVSALMYDSVRKTLGDEVFFECLKNYFNEYKYKNATGNDIKTCFNKYSTKNVSSLLEPWLEGNIYWG